MGKKGANTDNGKGKKIKVWSQPGGGREITTQIINFMLIHSTCNTRKEIFIQIKNQTHSEQVKKIK